MNSAAYFISIASNGETDTEFEFYRNHLSKDEYLKALSKAIEFNDLINISNIMFEANRMKYCELLPILEKKRDEILSYAKDTSWVTSIGVHKYRTNRFSKSEKNKEFFDDINELKKKCSTTAGL